MDTSQRKLEFIPVRCPKCDATLFRITPTSDTFSIEVKCRRCTLRRRKRTRRHRVNVIVRILLEPPRLPDLDLNSENSACG